MRNKITTVLLMLGLSLFTGCSTFDFFHSKTKSQDKISDKIEAIEENRDKINKNDGIKLSQIGTLAHGTHYALEKNTTTNREIDVAKKLTDRVVSLAGNPDVKSVIRIQDIVDAMMSEIKVEQQRGADELKRLDSELQLVQKDRDKLNIELIKKGKEFEDLSLNIAKKNDVNSETIDNMNKWFGLGAVFYGLKRFLISSILIIVILMVIFLVLRVLSATNPIAASIFSLFNIAAGWLLRLIKTVTPKAFEVEKYVEGVVHDKYKNALYKVVDAVEHMKEQNKVLPNDKKIKLEDILDNLDRNMNDADKATIHECLKELKWSV